jgi:hypothetical protein
MLKRLFTVASVISVLSISVAGQGPAQPSPKRPEAAKAAGAFVPAKTPWGDPDLQGNFTNKYEQGTPFERPAEFEGKRVDDVKGDELAELLQKRQQNAIERAPFLGGDPEGRIGGPAEFRDNNEIVKGGRPWFVTEPPDGKIPPTTPEARQRIAARPRGGSSFTNGPFSGPEELSLYDRCITRGFPGSMLPAIYGDSYQIVQGPGYVAIRYEMIHETRVIPLDGRPHVGSSLGLDMGDARGRWDGNTLVVETTNFRARSVYRNADPQKLRLVERFTRVAPGKIDWSVTVNDATTWTRPWTFAVPLTMNDSEPVFEYACHEGNYAVRNMLSASRAVEKAADRATTQK